MESHPMRPITQTYKMCAVKWDMGMKGEYMGETHILFQQNSKKLLPLKIQVPSIVTEILKMRHKV